MESRGMKDVSLKTA